MHVKEGEGNNWMHSSKFTMSHVLIRLRCIISQVKSYLISLPDMGSLFFQGCAAGTAAALKKKRDRLSSEPWAKQELWFLLGFGSWKQLLRSWEGWGAATLQSKMRHLLLVQVGLGNVNRSWGRQEGWGQAPWHGYGLDSHRGQSLLSGAAPAPGSASTGKAG